MTGTWTDQGIRAVKDVPKRATGGARSWKEARRRD
jgi:uncharacterized protein with GYD domain